MLCAVVGGICIAVSTAVIDVIIVGLVGFTLVIKGNTNNKRN